MDPSREQKFPLSKSTLLSRQPFGFNAVIYYDQRVQMHEASYIGSFCACAAAASRSFLRLFSVLSARPSARNKPPTA